MTIIWCTPDSCNVDMWSEFCQKASFMFTVITYYYCHDRGALFIFLSGVEKLLSEVTITELFFNGHHEFFTNEFFMKLVKWDCPENIFPNALFPNDWGG